MSLTVFSLHIIRINIQFKCQLYISQGEEMNLLHTGKDSESGFSFSEDLSQNMRDFEEFISHQRVAKGQQSQGENNQGGGNIDLAIGARSDLNMEVDENATAAG